jgi:hypothetical protein
MRFIIKIFTATVLTKVTWLHHCLPLMVVSSADMHRSIFTICCRLSKINNRVQGFLHISQHLQLLKSCRFGINVSLRVIISHHIFISRISFLTKVIGVKAACCSKVFFPLNSKNNQHHLQFSTVGFDGRD